MPSSPSLQRYVSGSPSQYSSRLLSPSEMTNPVVVRKCLLKKLVQKKKIRIIALTSFNNRAETIGWYKKGTWTTVSESNLKQKSLPNMVYVQKNVFGKKQSCIKTAFLSVVLRREHI